MLAPAPLKKRLLERGYQVELLQKDIDGSIRALQSPGNGGYSDHEEVVRTLLEWETLHPEWVQVVGLGQGAEVLPDGSHRRILAARFSRGTGVKPGVLIFGGIHAREVATTEVVLLMGRSLLRELEKDQELREWLTYREVWLLPCLNPDGRQYCLDRDPWWRKNRSLSESGHTGVDLNRNFGYRWGPNPPFGGSSGHPASGIYRGKQPFSEPETQALRTLVEARDFSLSLSLHSYGEMILMPFGYSDREISHPEAFHRLGNLLQDHLDYDFGSVPGVLGYFSNGRHDDWLYAGQGPERSRIFAVELEIGKSFFPRYESVRPLARKIYQGVRSILPLAGSQVDATVRLRSRPRSSSRDLEVMVQNHGVRNAKNLRIWLENKASPPVSYATHWVPRLEGLAEDSGDRSRVERFSAQVPEEVRDLVLRIHGEGDRPYRREIRLPARVD